MELCDGVAGFTLLDCWETTDIRINREEESWMNILLQKNTD